jgi:hypothetical protein
VEISEKSHNFGISGNQGVLRENVYQFSYHWSLQRELVKDFDVFWQGFYNQSALPRLRRFELPALIQSRARNPTAFGHGRRRDLDD